MTIVIYQSTDHEGSTFALSADSRRALAQMFGDRARFADRIFIAHEPGGAARFRGDLAPQLVTLLAGIGGILAVRDIEFRDPVTEAWHRS